MNRQEMINKTIAMRNGSLKMNREGEQWVPEELDILQERFFAGVPVNEIAIELERSEEEVYQLISRMRLYAAPAQPRGKRYTSFGGYVRFPSFGSSDLPPSDCLLFQRHLREGYIHV